MRGARGEAAPPHHPPRLGVCSGSWLSHGSVSGCLCHARCCRRSARRGPVRVRVRAAGGPAAGRRTGAPCVPQRQRCMAEHIQRRPDAARCTPRGMHRSRSTRASRTRPSAPAAAAERTVPASAAEKQKLLPRQPLMLLALPQHGIRLGCQRTRRQSSAMPTTRASAREGGEHAWLFGEKAPEAAPPTNAARCDTRHRPWMLGADRLAFWRGKGPGEVKVRRMLMRGCGGGAARCRAAARHMG